MSLPQDTAIELAKMRALLPPEPTATTLPGARLTITGLDPPEYDWVQDADNELREGIGDPNGLLRAPISTLYLDKTSGAPKVWQNQDGGTTWTDLTAGGSGSFPIIFDDGDNTYEIRATPGSTDLLIVNTRDAAGQDAYGLIQAEATATDGYVYLDSFSDAHQESSVFVQGSTGIVLQTAGVTGNGIQLETDGGAAIVLNSVGTGGNVSVEAVSAGGIVDVDAGKAIYLSAPETIFQGANATPTSADLLNNGDFGFWFDPVTKVLSVKGRDSGGTIRNLTIGTLT